MVHTLYVGEVAAATGGAVASHSEVFGVLRRMTQSTDGVCGCLSVAMWLEATAPDVLDQTFASSAELHTSALTTVGLTPRPPPFVLVSPRDLMRVAIGPVTFLQLSEPEVRPVF